jgi:hypothetical protein
MSRRPASCVTPAVASIFLGTRAIYRRAAQRRAVALQHLFDALVADMERAMQAP